jgi:hypothetical protein
LWRLEGGQRWFVTGGNASVMIAGSIRSDSSSGCVRKLLLRNHGVEAHINEATEELFDTGKEFEKQFEKRLIAKGTPYKADFKKIIDVGHNVNWTISLDFLLNSNVVVETKCATTKKRILETFVHGKYKMQHMIQLVSYMIALDLKDGFLVYGAGEPYKYSFKKVVKEFAQWDIYTFKVTLDDNKFVVKDTQTGVESLLCIRPEHVVRYLEYATWVLNEQVVNTLIPEPFSEFTDPCKYCEFNPVCEQVKGDVGIEDFIEACKTLIEQQKVDGQLAQEGGGECGADVDM